MPKAVFDLRYDRRVRDEFLKHFLPGGFAASLNDLALRAAGPLDLQMRKDPKTGIEWASLYVGLTDVLKVRSSANGLTLSAHSTHATKRLGFDPHWAKPAAPEVWEERWPAVEAYLERVIPRAIKSHGTTEGAVQAAVSKSLTHGLANLDREVMVAFRDDSLRRQVKKDCMTPLLDAIASADVPGQAPTKLGSKCDLIALDSAGRLLAVEVKPLDVGTITWVPAQAAMYASLLQAWVKAPYDEPENSPHSILTGMLAQRQKLGHAVGFKVNLPEKPKVVPVVAIQRGASEKYKARMLAVRAALLDVQGLAPIEIHEVSITGDFKRLA